MAGRGMSAAMLAEIEKGSVHFVHLIKFELDTPAYITDAHKNLTYDSNEYERVGHLLSIGAVTESLDIKVNKTTITLSGIDQAFISIFLSQNITNKSLTIYEGFLDDSGDLVDYPLEIFTGRADNFTCDEDTKSHQTKITITAANHWLDWERVSGRRTNSDDQQYYFPGDLGFNFASKIIKDLKWGQND
ncbi:MAG: hypothetical protein JKX76_04320 [Colwellia sp.]|nr:hypothetical protein [Colwellia sp.]